MTKRTVEFWRVNGLVGDPAVYGFFPKTGAAVLFDLGYLDDLANKDLLKVRLALVSHTHIDHFIGFDRLLRVNIPHFRPVELVGPPGLIANVEGKLKGYLWNLVEPDQIRFTVHEVDRAGSVKSAHLVNQTGFVPEATSCEPPRPGLIDPPLPPAPVASIAAFGDGTRFEATALDHKTPSIAYACQLPMRFSVKSDVLEKYGLAPGPWIRELQVAIGKHDLDLPFTVDGKRFRAEELGALIFDTYAPRPLGYMTDAGFTRSNIERAVQLFRGTETLVSETNYRDTEAVKAKDRMHLTTRQAALIAAAAGVARLEIFHLSNIYLDEAEAVVAEANTFFTAYRGLSPGELEAAIARELHRLGER